jgi:hypothetical protein
MTYYKSLLSPFVYEQKVYACYKKDDLTVCSKNAKTHKEALEWWDKHKPEKPDYAFALSPFQMWRKSAVNWLSIYPSVDELDYKE